jgi:hypothetical protein
LRVSLAETECGKGQSRQEFLHRELYSPFAAGFIAKRRRPALSMSTGRPDRRDCGSAHPSATGTKIRLSPL